MVRPKDLIGLRVHQHDIAIAAAKVRGVIAGIEDRWRIVGLWNNDVVKSGEPFPLEPDLPSICDLLNHTDLLVNAIE